ncbi:hypothetical protein [Hymenobacter amundsenii]|uniref:hypothetical protein n=1 Tax=Hymenobacter amundsenii TaxID=2006685 RepID=UPI0013FE42B9|nr:hypothetical protein [Hymenobacter amundsenii]
MPSPQHTLLKQFLVASAAPLARRRPSLPTMRLAVEMMAFGQFMPWDIFLEEADVEGMAAEWIRRPAPPLAG